MGVINFLMVRFVEVIVVLLLVLFMPSVPPYTNFTYFKVSPPQNLEGKLALNERLSGVEHLYENELKGPEAFAEYNGELYTSIHGGDVVKFSKGHIVPIVKFGKPCSGYTEESICGRPLGIKFDQNGLLYVADAYNGIWTYDIKTGQKTLVVSMNSEIEGKKPKLPNSIAISKNGDIFWTDSSSDFALEDGVFAMLADGSGRLIHYDAKTKTNKVLMDGLQFANGVVLSSDEEFIVVAETARSRLYRFYLKGPKKGTHDIFADGLPGLPDNLNSDGKDGFLVPLVVARDSDNPVLTQVIGPFPLIRKLVARIIALIELGFKTLHKIYPNIYAQTAVHWIGHFESISPILPARTTILHISKSGEILDSIHTTDKSISGLSEAFIFGDHLYLGSPYNPYVGRISLDKIGLADLKQKSVPKQTATPKQQTPLPKEQTPSPTAAPKQQTPPPTVPSKQQTPSPTAAPKQQTPPTAAPKQETSPPTAAPKQQSPPPTAAPKQQTPPPTAAPKQQTPPVKTSNIKKTEPMPEKQTNANTKQIGKGPEKEAAKVIPVKENTVPKSESVKPRK